MSERVDDVEKARLSDAVAIQKLINGYADRGDMLHRPLSHIYENIRDFYVYRQGGVVIGCVALHVLWRDLVEVRGLAVQEKCQHQGIGSKLVKRCLVEAKVLEVPKVFLLTYKPKFFERFGFALADITTIPRKLWGECYDCPKGPPPNCGEIAMVRYQPFD